MKSIDIIKEEFPITEGESPFDYLFRIYKVRDGLVELGNLKEAGYRNAKAIEEERVWFKNEI